MSLYSNPVVILWIILIIALVLSSVYFLIQRLKAKDDPARKRIMLVIFIMFLSIGVSRLFHLIAILNHGSFEGDFSLENNLIFTISQVFLIIGLIMIIFSFEKRIYQRKRNYYTILITIISVIYFVFRHLSMFNETDTTLSTLAKILSYTGNGILGLFGLYLALMYLKISIKTSGSVKRKAFLAFTGFFLLLGSYTTFILEELLVDTEITYLISIMFVLFSIPFLLFGYK